MAGEPVRGPDESLGEQRDIETQVRRLQIDRLLSRGEKVDEQRGQLRLVEQACHQPIAGAMPAAAAPVSEQHDAPGALGQAQIALEDHRPGQDADRLLFAFPSRRLGHHPHTAQAARPAPGLRASSSRTSSSVVWEKSSYQRPTA